MRKILYDMTVYQTGTQFHGGGEYSYTILKALMETKDRDTKVDVFIGERGRKDNAVLERCSKAGMEVFCCVDASELTRVVKDGDYDTLYSALPTKKYYEGLRLDSKVHLIITLHGLRKIELRERGQYKYFETPGRWKGDLKNIILKIVSPVKYMESLKDEYNYLLDITENYTVVTDSYHSKYSVMQYFPQITEKRLRMFYAPAKLTKPINDADYEKKTLQKFHVSSKQFSLIISANRYEKNAERLISAWDMVLTNCRDFIPAQHRIVVLGVKSETQFNRIIKKQNRSRFQMGGYVEPEELESLYKHAHLFLFGSLSEGLGYPPLEAIKYGTLVAASVNTSIAETCERGTLLFNPLLVSEISNRILQSFDAEVVARRKEVMASQYTYISEKQKRDLGRIVQTILNQGGEHI